MNDDVVQVEEALLALLGVFEFENGRVWRRYDFATMDRCTKKGSSPNLAVGRSRST